MLSIIPKPNGRVTADGSCISMPKAFSVCNDAFAPWCVQAFYERTGCQVADEQWIMLSKNDTYPTEGYCLEVGKEGVHITASSETGVIWALATLFQLIAGDGTLPVCQVEDYPKHGHRGLSLDCARHFFPVCVVKKVIEQISVTKMNVLHWHLTDDQAWRIESKAFPKLCETSVDYYTQDEIRDVVEYAHLRGVEIIPEIDLPGHTTGILAAYPQFGCFGKTVSLATSGGIYPVILCAGKDATFEMIEKLLDEICPLFPSKRFHIGGDEAPKSEWDQCPDCKGRMEAEGIENTEDLQGYFTVRVAKMLAKHGKSIICWNDSLKANNLPADVLIQYWTVQHAQSMAKYYATGGKFIYADMMGLYLDYPYSISSLKKVYTIKPHIHTIDCSEAAGLVGMEVCLWSERIVTPDQLYKRLFPRCQALAENAWTKELDYESFKGRLSNLLLYADKNGVSYTAQDWWEPKGEGKINEAFAYLQGMNSFASLKDGNAAKALAAMNLSADRLVQMMAMFFDPEDMSAVISRLNAMLGL